MREFLRRNRVRAVALAAFAILALAGREVSAQPRPVSIGVNANYEQNLALTAHLGWSRIDILWSAVEPQPGVFTFSALDGQINFAASQGQQILAILHRVPAWAGGGPNENIPPLTTNDWSDFVSRVAQRYNGRIAAYEIWNEPDLSGNPGAGIGWDRNIEQPPLYVDFVHAAAVQIRAQAPGTLVVAPVLASFNTAYGSDNRKTRIFQQIQAASYPDGPGPSFVDVASFHGNGEDSGADQMAYALINMNLGYLAAFGPSLRYNPVWVTEFGWRSNAVGFDGQRQYICEYLRLLTGSWDAGQPDLDQLAQWNIQRAFIYLLKDPTNQTSRVIFAPNSTPNLVVTQYLQLLSYPAVQSTVVNGDYDYPSCLGPSYAPPLNAAAGFGPSYAHTLKAAAGGADWSMLGALGLADPRAALPSGFSTTKEQQSPDGRGLEATFEDSRGGRIVLHVAAHSKATEAGFLTDAGAAWSNGLASVELDGMRADRPIGKAVLHSLAAAIDHSLAHACIVESMTADEAAVERLGFRVPAAPAGFTRSDDFIQFTRATGECAGSPGAAPTTFDFTWKFAGKKGEILRAGVYNYGYFVAGPQHSRIDARSLNWTEKGARYWVAVDPATDPQRVQDDLYLLARSLDPAFSR
jgi:hypothetical protein